MKTEQQQIFSLNNLIQGIIDNRIILDATVFTTFISIPAVILSSEQKIILQIFMALGRHTQFFTGNVMHVSQTKIAALTGLSADQVHRALKLLPDACNNVMKKRMLTKGESIAFHIKDENGNDIKKNTTRKPSYYILEYTTPQITTITKIGFTTSKVKEEAATPQQNVFDIDKWNEIKKLTPYFEEEALGKLMDYSLDEIKKGVKYYLYQLRKKIKQDPGATLNMKYLIDIFERKYYLSQPKETPAPVRNQYKEDPAKKAREDAEREKELQRSSNLHKRIREKTGLSYLQLHGEMTKAGETDIEKFLKNYKKRK